MASSPTADETDPDDPIGYFLEDLRFHGKSERTRKYYERVLWEFEQFLADSERNPGGESLAPGEATRRDCMAWVHGLRTDLAESSVATYASYLHRFYDYMTQVGEFDANPMALVVEEMNESIDKDPTRREISVPQMRSFVVEVTHPLEWAVVVSLLKTGLRVGELCNLDLRDLRLSGEVAEAYRLGARPQLDGRGNSLFVASVDRGETVNAEERSAANKRKRATIVPVDEELAAVLTRWLAIRPDAISDAEPLSVSTSKEVGDSRHRWSGTSWRLTRARPGGTGRAVGRRRT